MAVVSLYVSIITLNENWLTSPIKRHRVWMIKTTKTKLDSMYTAYKRLIFNSKDTHRMKVKGWKKSVHAGENQTKAWLSILIPGKKMLSHKM